MFIGTLCYIIAPLPLYDPLFHLSTVKLMQALDTPFELKKGK